MKTPRLALLALCSLLASFAAAADPGWTPKVQSGTAWTSVTFKIESGESKTYWFRSDAKGPTAPLYALKLEKQDPKNPSVVGSALFSSAVTVYTIKTAYGPDRLTVSQAGRPNFSPRGTITGTKGAATIVVTSPGAVPEKLDPSPITVYTPDLAPIKWDDYYYTKPARAAEYWGIYDPDSAYRDAQASFGHLHRRVLPFELMFGSDNCFVRPETCTKAKDPKNYARYAEAASEAAKGNLLLVKPLAADNHREYAKAAADFKTTELGKDAAVDKFSEKENRLLEKLLVENKLLPAFQAEMIKARAKPETLKQFVAKWRTYLKAEIDIYLKESEAAGQDEIKHAVHLAAMRDRITKTAALPLKPAAGPNTPTKPVIDPATGKPKPGDVAAKPKPGAFKINPEDLLWRDKVTAIGSWRAVATETQIPGASAKDFYCYHVKMTAAEKIAAHLIKNKTVMVECVDWAAPKDDAVQTEGKTKFKVRAAKTKFNLAAVKGKLTIVNDDGSPAGVGGAVTEKPAPTAAAVATHVKVTLAPAAPDAPAMILLSERELTWLEKTRSVFYSKNIPKEAAALEAFRNEIIKNLDEDKKAIDNYNAARKDAKTKEDIDKGLREVWGGKDNKEIVGLAGSRTEIQLSPEDHKALLALPGTAARDYDENRALADGGRKSGKAYNSNLYDPILLHRTVRAALKALGKTDAAPVVAPKPDENAVQPLLDEKTELPLLTDRERKEYDSYVKNSKGKLDDANLQKMIKALRAKIAAEERAKKPAYVEPKTLEEYNALPEFQQRRFCDNLPPLLSVVQKDKRAAPLDTQANADKGLNNSAATTVTKEIPAPASDVKKDVDPALRKACAAKAPEAATDIDPSDKGPKKEGAVAANIVNGEDVNGPKEKENKWLTKPLIASASKGALVGLILGSLFGPIGLIAGPIIGGVFFYGLNKMADMKAEKAKENE